jgi:hypothetical protein
MVGLVPVIPIVRHCASSSGSPGQVAMTNSVIDRLHPPRLLVNIVDAAHPSFAISRSLNFWILPVDVFGNSANMM